MKINEVTLDDFPSMPIEYQQCCEKIILSHATNELYGAEVFDEPAIALAPTPYAKWLTCRVAMDEYGHHIRFRELAKKLGIHEEKLDSLSKRHSSIFEFEMKKWSDFCAIKILADLGETLQAEDLSICSFLPLRALGKQVLSEERFHVDFGLKFSKILCRTKQGAKEMQDSIDRYFPLMPAFFGNPNSKNNLAYIHWGIKQRSNEEMLTQYIKQARELVESILNLSLPEIL